MLTAAISANLAGVVAAFGAGIVSFLSPCVLPLVPGYLSMMTGLSAGALEEAEGSPKVLGPIAGFIAGFTVIFVILGASASSIGAVLRRHEVVLQSISGVIVIGFGLLLIISSLPAGMWRRAGSQASSAVAAVVQERRVDLGRLRRVGIWTAPVLGMAFAFAWTPCLGPILGSVLALASTTATLLGGIVLLFAYSMGLAVPFVASGFAVSRVTGAARRFGRAMAILQGVGGVILVAFGILLVTHQVSWLSSQVNQLLIWLHLNHLVNS